MKKLGFILLTLVALHAGAQQVSVSSPNGAIQLQTSVTNGKLTYTVRYKNKAVLLPSQLSVRLKTPTVDLSQFTLVRIDSSVYDQSWKPVWGEYSTIRDHHKELLLALKDKGKSGILLNVVFRVFDEGVGFRYEFPQQANLDHFVVADERTQFHLSGDHMTFWIPGDYDSNEYTYNHTRLSAVDASIGKTFTSISSKTLYDKNAVQTPLMMKSNDGLYINLHEAALLNYPAMQLLLDKKTFTLTSHLVPDAVGNKAYMQAPAHTPWRTVIVSDKATDIIAADRMILNLNEPSKVANTSFIKPQKFVGVWWEMHVNKSSWDYGVAKTGSFMQPHGHHGANTANVKRYIDFAAKNGIDAVLVEGGT